MPRFRCHLSGLDTSTAVRLRSPSRSPPDAITRAFSSSLTTTVFSQRSMRWLDASPRRATPKGHQSFISCTAPRSVTPLPQSDLPRSWHTPVPESTFDDTEFPRHLCDRTRRLDHQLHRFFPELRSVIMLAPCQYFPFQTTPILVGSLSGRFGAPHSSARPGLAALGSPRARLPWPATSTRRPISRRTPKVSVSVSVRSSAMLIARSPARST